MSGLATSPPVAPPAAPAQAAPPWNAVLAAVVHRGLLDGRRSVLSWGGSLGVLGAFMAAVYPSIHHTLEQVARHYPKGLKQAFDVGTLSTGAGYVHAEMFSLIVPLAIGYLAIRSVAAATAGAEEDGRLDTTLALPVPRSALLVGTWVSTALITAAVMAVVGIAIWVSGALAESHISALQVTDGVVGVWPVALVAGGVCAVVAGARPGAHLAVGVSLGVLIASYALDLVGRLAGSLEPLRWFSIFHLYGSPMLDGIWPLPYLGLIVLSLALTAAGTALFERRDILH